MDRTNVQKNQYSHVCLRLISDFHLTIGSPMHTISKKLAKREKQAKFPTSEQEKYFGVASGSAVSK